MHEVLLVVRYSVVVLLVLWAMGQVRRPTGPLGRMFAWSMNRSHSSLTDWGLGHIQVGKGARLLDVGCGGGRTVQKLAALATGGSVRGLDFSKASIAIARATNAREIASGRVRLDVGSVAALPYADAAFDAVIAVETHYYWPDLPATVREVFRVVKPGGSFIVIAETYRGQRFSFFYRLVMPLIRAAYLSESGHRDLLTQAGFTQVETFVQPASGWICVVGHRAG